MDIAINVCDKYKGKTFEELKQIYISKSGEEIVMFLNPDMDKNIGCVMRTASAYFFKKIVILGRKKTNFISSVGVNHYMPIEYINASSGIYNENLDIEKIEQYLIDLSKTHIIIFCEISDKSIKLQNMNKQIKLSGKPPAFLLGNEQKGIPIELINSEKFKKIIVEIPMYGFIHSYNVSNSFAMIYYEYIRDLV